MKKYLDKDMLQEYTTSLAARLLNRFTEYYRTLFAAKGETATDEQVSTAVTAWLDENVDPVGSAVVVDDTLSIEGAAADAEVVGGTLKETNTVLADATKINGASLSGLAWEPGAFSSSGNNLDSETYLTYWMRSDYYPAREFSSIMATCLSGFGTDLEIWCAQYTQSKTWIGYEQREIARGTQAGSEWGLDAACAYVRFTATHLPRSTTAISDVSDPLYVQLIAKPRLQESLERKYGYRIRGLRTGNSENLIFSDISEITRNSATGITWNLNEDGSVSVSGTPSSTALFNYFYSETSLPSWVKPGETYRVIHSAAEASFRVLYHDGTSWKTIINTKTDTTFTVPSDAVGLIIRLAVTGGHTANETVSPIVYTVAPNAVLEERLDRINHAAGGPFFKYYTQFIKGSFASDDETRTITLDPTNLTDTRRSVIVHMDEPVHLMMTNTDYTVRLYFYDEYGTLAHMGWGDSWEVPAGKDVLITIKKANPDNGAFADGEYPQDYLVVYDEKPKPYFLSEIDDVVERVKAANTEPGLCFLLSTDQHTMSVQQTLLKYDTISDMVSNMKAVARKIHIDGNISLGDISDFMVGNAEHFEAYGVTDNTDYPSLDILFYHWMDRAMDQLASVHPNLIYVPGNHDDNRYINSVVLQELTSGYDYSPGEMYSYYSQRSQLRRVPNASNNGLDYYIDYPDFKIRMFCLHSNHYYDEEHTSPDGYHNCWRYGFQTSTAEWLEEELSRIPAGYSVMVLSHMSPVATHNPGSTAYVNMNRIESAIQSFISGGGDYIATLYGHAHVDWHATDPWLEIAFSSQKCYNSQPAHPNMPGEVRPERTKGTATEDCWNIVLIQPGSRKIKVIRFGAGEDREFSY